jgi:serine/threonine protein kinase
VNDDRWSIVQLLLGAALAREPQERAAFLRKVCGEDEALRRDVESLVAHAASGAGLLSTPALRWEVEALLDAPASGDGVFAQPAMAAAAQRTSDPAATDLTGRRLGVYQLKDRIGVGGMGEVYRARDTKLGRDVAIKIPPRAATSDPDRLARFEREARVLAALNHPNIAIIHDFEKADGVRALVMELVEGETLADRIAWGSMPIDEALLMAKQIAQALEAAHEQGIVHRDLKPANVKIRPDGTVKVLDFGLAKALDTAAHPGDASQSATADSRALTHTGVILGTAPYMAPEQARGGAADRRADIWAFGCVLFEMLAGRSAFGKPTVSEVRAASTSRLRAVSWIFRRRSVTPTGTCCSSETVGCASRRSPRIVSRLEATSRRSPQRRSEPTRFGDRRRSPSRRTRSHIILTKARGRSSGWIEQGSGSRQS